MSSKELPPSTSPFFPNIFFYNQFRAKPSWPPASTNLTGQVAIITGGNAGLGYECAMQLLSLRLTHLILAVRSPSRGEAAASKLRHAYPKSTIDVWPLDMSSYDSIQTFTARISSQLPRLDTVILNAGVRHTNFLSVPGTGHEETIQVNYLSTVLLTILLLPILKTKSPSGIPGRITIINAALALLPKLPSVDDDAPLLKSFDSPAQYDANGHYCMSKLFAHAFLYKLVDYVSADDVVVNLADPAFVKGTGLIRDVNTVGKVFMALFGALCGRTVKVGASTFVDAAVVKGKESHGCFLMSWKIEPFNSSLYTSDGERAVEQLWRETMDELAFADVRGVLQSMKKGL
ncbi:short-chain dehydrogenase/reductase family protein [Aspergillus heteromorphus CBS 117.55]|uniref:Short-chain dehydrogenase/reductase family protein n=1 Tax=Aspergillus heteromorphus CBS 117.55 TaxID=1448321 RepID=A0A317X0P1_9EURO|nr:short-chain dehydrogenase/reductase family protein [Aspergillus heteromorphus CBS 117.55]PWY92224.1 short-chain dehydrogenase/reductase family protein [Aspergillus heteromorphus CBS 117.55]